MAGPAACPAQSRLTHGNRRTAPLKRACIGPGATQLFLFSRPPAIIPIAAPFSSKLSRYTACRPLRNSARARESLFASAARLGERISGQRSRSNPLARSRKRPCATPVDRSVAMVGRIPFCLAMDTRTAVKSSNQLSGLACSARCADSASTVRAGRAIVLRDPAVFGGYPGHRGQADHLSWPVPHPHLASADGRGAREGRQRTGRPRKRQHHPFGLRGLRPYATS